MAVADSAEDLHLVGFSPGSRPLVSALAAGDVLFEILLLEFDSRLDSIYNYTYGRAVGFPEYAYPEFYLPEGTVFPFFSIIFKSSYLFKMYFLRHSA